MFKILRPVIFTIIALLVFWFLVRPLFADVGSLRTELNEYKDVVEQAVSFNRLLDNLVAERSSFSAFEIESINTIAPSTIDEVRALVDLEALAEEHGLAFSGVDEEIDDAKTEDSSGAPTDEAAGMPFESRTVSFNVSGSYSQFKDFLRDVERSMVLMDIEKIAFTSTGLDIASYQFEVRLYGLPSSDNAL